MASEESTTETSEANETTTKNDTLNDIPELQFVVEGERYPSNPTTPLWIATLNDTGHTVEIVGKSKEQVEQRAKEILGQRSFVPEQW